MQKGCSKGLPPHRFKILLEAVVPTARGVGHTHRSGPPQKKCRRARSPAPTSVSPTAPRPRRVEVCRIEQPHISEFATATRSRDRRIQVSRVFMTASGERPGPPPQCSVWSGRVKRNSRPAETGTVKLKIAPASVSTTSSSQPSRILGKVAIPATMRAAAG